MQEGMGSTPPESAPPELRLPLPELYGGQRSGPHFPVALGGLGVGRVISDVSCPQ